MRKVEEAKTDRQQPSAQAIEPMPTGRPGDVAVFPYLVYMEFLAALLCTIVLMVWSLGVDAPLLQVADPGRTENPAKAPWYFVGLQELLVYFDPWIAGVMIPTLIIVGLMAIPYLDTSRNAVGRYTLKERRLVTSHFVFGFTLWWVLIAIGQYLRGPNWHIYWPWEDWSVAKSAEAALWDFPWWVGLPALGAYFGLGLYLPQKRWPWLRQGLGGARYVGSVTLALLFYGVPIKMLLRLLFNVKYVLVTPWFNI